MILHRLFCLVFDVMSVSMTDEMDGYIRPPDESGGYRMTDGIECFSQYPTIPNTQQKDKSTPVAIAQLAIEHNCECGSDFFSELSKNFKDAFT
jgi:hypothetical protein